ncbi:MAG TPA: hypothetical protein EYG92_09105 [Lutibacter sp.]|nr:hypothetical protein [Lutibacter sp.]
MSKVNGLISLKEYNDMKSSFNTNVRSSLGSHSTDSVWWSIQDLRAYLDLIESESPNDSSSITGVSFNFVAKEDTDEKLTLALRPTYDERGVNTIYQAGSILDRGVNR